MATVTEKALVLDFGGVISRTLFETHELSEIALGLPTGTLSWRGPFEPETDPLWRSMQADEISEREYWLQRSREVGHMLGKDWNSMQQFVRAARGADPAAIIRPEALETIRQVKEAGKRLAILSNELDLFYGSDFRARLPFLQEFELIVDATHTKILKPDPAAYEIVEGELDLPASSLILVDDQMRNIRGAELAGWHGVLFDVQNPTDGYNQALELLGLPPLKSDLKDKEYSHA